MIPAFLCIFALDWREHHAALKKGSSRTNSFLQLAPCWRGVRASTSSAMQRTSRRSFVNVCRLVHTRSSPMDDGAPNSNFIFSWSQKSLRVQGVASSVSSIVHNGCTTPGAAEPRVAPSARRGDSSLIPASVFALLVHTQLARGIPITTIFNAHLHIEPTVILATGTASD